MKKFIPVIAFLTILNFSCTKKSTPAPVTPPANPSLIAKWYISKTTFSHYDKGVLVSTAIHTGNNVDYYSFNADKSGTVLESGTVLSSPTTSNFTYVATPKTLVITFAPGTIPGETNDVQSYSIETLTDDYLYLKSDVTDSTTGARDIFQMLFIK